MNLEKLQEWSIQRIQRTPLIFKRYLWKEIDWRNRLILVVGARGVGKTTLLLQYLKEKHSVSQEALYASMDNLYFAQQNLVELAESFVQRGGRVLVLDEVHKHSTWSREIKVIYDQFPDLQLVLSGSSTVELLHGEGDLSRRARIYHLNGLSFREYLQFLHGYYFPPVDLASLLVKATELSAEISGQIRPIQRFEEYLKHGYYPFFQEDPEGYGERIRQIVNVIIESDVPAVFQVDYNAVVNMKKLLGLLTEMMPFKPNIQKLSRQIDLSRETLIKYLQYLGKADVLQLLYSQTKGISQLNKPEKIYLHNPNLAFALGEVSRINKGSLRETFFLNQLAARHEVRYPGEQGDFIIDDKYWFEVGGAGKGEAQIRATPNGWIAADNIEIATGRKIPLWLLGFLY